MRRIHFVSIAALAIPALLIFAGRRAFADTLPPAQFYATDEGSGNANLTTQTDPGTFSESRCAIGGCETTTWSFSYGNGAASASVGGVVTYPGNAAGVSSVTMYFAVVGNYNGMVPVVVTASANTSVTLGASDEGVAEASVAAESPTATGGIQDDGRLDACAAVGSSVCTSYSNLGASFTNATIGLDVAPNQLGSSASYIVVSAAVNTFGGGFSSFVDPMISFARGFDSTGLSLEFSPNPPSAVPEPGTLILLGIGLLGLALMTRRRCVAHG